MKRFHPDVRLKRMLAAPGGLPSSVALQKASENLESLRASGRDEIVSKIAQLAALRGQGPSAQAAMYEVANEIFGDAGVFGWTDISDVAHSLCGVLDSTSEMQGDVVAVHVQALTALSEMNPAEDQAARRAVVAGLKSLARRKTGGTAHAA